MDYDAALAQIDRGMTGLRPLSRSDSAEMQGIAMAPAVIRNGKAKTHIIFSAAPLVTLILPEATIDDKEIALSILAHECAHVQVNAHKEAAIPEARLGTRIEGFERGVYYQIAEICWEEYAACRISAPFARNQCNGYAETVKAVVASARERSNEAIKSYRLHADLYRLVSEAGGYLCDPLKAVSYLLGGMDAEGVSWDDYQDVRAAIDQGGYWTIVEQLHGVLSSLWETQGQWTPSLSQFDPLLGVVKGTYESGGMFFTTNPDGSGRIDVPFTLATMPLGAF